MVECAQGLDAGVCVSLAGGTRCVPRSSQEHRFQANRHRHATRGHADDCACRAARRPGRCAHPSQPPRSSRGRPHGRHSRQPEQVAGVRGQFSDTACADHVRDRRGSLAARRRRAGDAASSGRLCCFDDRRADCWRHSARLEVGSRGFSLVDVSPGTPCQALWRC